MKLGPNLAKEMLAKVPPFEEWRIGRSSTECAQYWEIVAELESEVASSPPQWRCTKSNGPALVSGKKQE